MHYTYIFIYLALTYNTQVSPENDTFCLSEISCINKGLIQNKLCILYYNFMQIWAKATLLWFIFWSNSRGKRTFNATRKFSRPATVPLHLRLFSPDWAYESDSLLQSHKHNPRVDSSAPVRSVKEPSYATSDSLRSTFRNNLPLDCV